MKRNLKVTLMLLGAGAIAFASGCSWVARMFGDSLGDFFTYNLFLD